MQTRAELKAAAKQQLRGHWGSALLFTLVIGVAYALISYVINFILITAFGENASPLVSIVTFVVTTPLVYATVTYYLRLQAGQEANFDVLSSGLSGRNFGQLLLVNALLYVIQLAVGFVIGMLAVAVLATLGLVSSVAMPDLLDGNIAGLLLIVVVVGIVIVAAGLAGVMVTAYFALAKFLLVDRPELTAGQALARSRQLMKGHVWEYCLLMLSFLGWWLVAACTCGVGLLWLLPYLNLVETNYYRAIAAQAGDTPGETVADTVPAADEIVEPAQVVDE